MADLIVGADGVGVSTGFSTSIDGFLKYPSKSVVRKQIGITPKVEGAAMTCYRCYARTEDIKRLGLASHLHDPVV